MRLSLGLKVSLAAIIGIGALTTFQVLNASATAPINAPNALSPLPNQPAGVPFPTKAWPRQELALGQTNVLDKAFDGSIPEIGQTNALLVVKGGKIIYEKYGTGFDKDTKLLSWSVAKSITSGIFGALMQAGKINYDMPIADPHWRSDDERYKITYGQALRMTDGLDWHETKASSYISNDAAIMLFGKGREDIVKYTTSKRQSHKAGEVWNYSSGTSNLISAGMARILGPRTIDDPTGKEKYRNFIYDNFFHPIGMNDTSTEFDAAGNFYGSSFIYATAQDYARFGLLFLRNGVWENKRILPEGFVDYVRTPTQARGAENYGAHWWVSTNNKKGLLKNGPYDAFDAQGRDGQLIVIIPSKDLIIVRMGSNMKDDAWPKLGEFISQIAENL